jgi:predicted ATP-grasp superfamily ATP-dependent carboligase
MPGELIFSLRAKLERPIMIMGFGGWADAGKVATGAVNYLLSRLPSRPLATIQPDRFFDFTQERPMAEIENGRLAGMGGVELTFSYVKGRRDERDLALFTGPEPHTAWDRFSDLVFDLVNEVGVEAIITLGGTYDYLPHWLPAQTSAVYSSDAAAGFMAEVDDLQPADYRGPISIHTEILRKGEEAGVPVIGLWGHAPVYIQTGNIKLYLHIIEMLKKVVGFELDTDDLLDGIKDMDRQIEDLVAENPRLREYLDEINKEFEGQAPSSGRRPRRPRRPRPEGKVINLKPFLDNEDD